MHIADQPQGRTALSPEVARARANLMEERKKSKNEFCVLCLCDMGFPKSLHIDDPKRFADGAAYVEGGGQTCGYCNKK